jgi:hypothetical protein
MTAGEVGDEHLIDDVLLSDDDFFDFCKEALAGGGDEFDKLTFRRGAAESAEALMRCVGIKQRRKCKVFNSSWIEIHFSVSLFSDFCADEDVQ